MAVHGGDLTIFHKGEYYLTVGHDRVVGDKDLPKGLPSGKWGIHDGAVLDWIYDDIMDKTSKGRRWYTTFQTLSSHEPWIVPYTRLKDDEIANTFAYVDDAIGRFVDRLKRLRHGTLCLLSSPVTTDATPASTCRPTAMPTSRC